MSNGVDSQITALVASTLHVDKAMIRRDATLVGDLGADSLGLVALILAIEAEFNVDIYDEEVAQILTVEQMIEYVSFALATQEPPLTSRRREVMTVGAR